MLSFPFSVSLFLSSLFLPSDSHFRNFQPPSLSHAMRRPTCGCIRSTQEARVGTTKPTHEPKQPIPEVVIPGVLFVVVP